MLVYRTFSVFQGLLILIFKIAYITLAAFVLYHYNENPIVTTCIAILCLIFFLITGSDEIILYTTSIRYKTGSIFKSLNRPKILRIIDILSIKVDGIYAFGDELYNPRNGKDKPLNKVEIKLKDNSIIIFKTNIYIDKLKIVASEIEKLIKN